MFYRWGRVAFRHRRVIPLVVIAIILVMQVLFGAKLGDRLSQEGWEDPGAESTAAAQIEQDTFGRDNAGDVIVLVSAPGGVQDKALIDAANSQISALQDKHPEQIDHVTSYFAKQNQQQVTADGTQAFAAIGLKGDGEQTLKDFRAIEPDLRAIELPGDATVQIAGATAVADALDDGMANDIARAEKVGLIFVAIILLFVFGGVVAAAMPLIVGILSILGSLSLLSVLAQFQQVNIFSQSVITLLGLGLAIDYGLFMVSRFREELDRGLDVEEAVAVTTTTAGKTVFFSALMVGVALSGLLMFPQAFLKSVAYGAISAVVLAAVISVAVLPALFGMLGTRIDMWSVRRTSRKARRLEDTVWYRIPAWAMRNSKKVVVGITALLFLITAPMVGITFGGINESYLPPSQETRQSQDAFNEAFPAFRTDPVKLVVTGASNEQLGNIVMQTRQVSGLASPLKPSHPTQDGTTILSAPLADRNGGQEVVDQLRGLDVPEGVQTYVSGTPAMEVESIEALLHRLPWMALYMVAATFLLMALLFGSLILPAKAVIMNVLGIGATLGFLTAVFVGGHGASLLNFTAGPLMSPVLVLIVAILYGLSTDYEVFLVSRMVESRHNGASTDQAIKEGTAHTGGIITAAAAIMIVVAAAFAMSDIVMMKYIAFGMIFSLALDATIIRLLLVPAVMHLLREDNWWAPRWVKRAYASLGEGGESSAGTAGSQPAPAAPAQPADDPETHPGRAGVSVEENHELVPFRELMRQLEERKALEYIQKRELER
ncbi:MMPL family transporter [Corynebacterium gottingense]|uniref:MMPL family transporter n=1 Tax=Corynebacterium gottingense TaxID=2041036 RepID=A0ABX9UJ53_9CORY|nr:MMPL family transporter [Corynebacterium gottingense]RMD19111.1 MMPL family transporter [Corynebacterium gottingense]WJZ14046.1 Membrane protein YdfJ [Corynebacterium gottingense]WJZ16361.1 Membrane protein YdfJ [Corynebacterium gottingense]